jgi:hypothetical protein
LGAWALVCEGGAWVLGVALAAVRAGVVLARCDPLAPVPWAPVPWLAVGALALAGALVVVVVALTLAALLVLAVLLEPQPLARTAKATGKKTMRRRDLDMRAF